MKKIFLLITLFVSFKVFGQFTQPMNFGSKTTLVTNKGGFVSDSALILPHFNDTASANLGPAPKFYPGNLIRTIDDTLWFRNNTATKWIKIGGSAATTITADNGLTANTATNVRLGSVTNSDADHPLLYTTYINTTTFSLDVRTSSPGVSPLVGEATTGSGVYGYSSGTAGIGVTGQADGVNGFGVVGTGYYGVQGFANTGAGLAGGWFQGKASNSAVTTGIKITHNTSGPAYTSGVGSSISFEGTANSGGGTNRVKNEIKSIWSDPNDASRTSQFIVTGVESATTQNVLVINGNGSIQFPQYVGGDFAGTPAYGLAVDASGNVILGTAGGGIAGITADNGLTASTSTNVQFGGTLIHNTTVDGDFTTLFHNDMSGLFTFSAKNDNSNGSAISGDGGLIGVYGQSVNGNGMQAQTTDGVGLYAQGTNNGFAIFATTANSATAIFGQATSGLGIVAANIPGSTNSIEEVMQIKRNTSGTAADGIAGSLGLYAQTTTASQLANQIIWKWTTAANATRTSEFSVTGVNSTTAQSLLTISGTGAAKLNQYGSGTFTGTPTFGLYVDASGNIIEGTASPGGGTGSNLSYDAANQEVDIDGGGTSAVIPLAVADGATEGLASFTAADFDATAGNISIDYTNAQAASGANKGFLTSADWTTFNNKANAALDNLSSVAINASLLPGTDNAIDLGSATKQWKDLYMTGASIYMSGVKTLSAAGLDLPTGGGIRTRTSAGNTVLFQAYDVDGAAYSTFATLTANNTPTFDLSSSVTVGGASILTTTAAALAYQPLDADLTTIAGLTATTDNFIVSVSSAWASRTPSQVRTTLGLVIGTNVEAWDADLDTWAGITPGSNVGTFLATPSSANLRGALTDENGTGVALFNAATTPSFTTGIQIGGAAASRKILVGDGTNFIPSTETWATPSTTGNVLTSDGTNWVSSPTVKYAAATAGTTTNNTLTDLTGMSIALTAGTWVFDIWIFGQAGTGTAGAQFGVNYTGTTTSIEANCAGQVSTTTFAATTRITAINTASVVVFTTSAAEGWVHISGKIVVSDAGNLVARGLKVTSQTLTWRASSWMKAYKVS